MDIQVWGIEATWNSAREPADFGSPEIWQSRWGETNHWVRVDGAAPADQPQDSLWVQGHFRWEKSVFDFGSEAARQVQLQACTSPAQTRIKALQTRLVKALEQLQPSCDWLERALQCRSAEIKRPVQAEHEQAGPRVERLRQAEERQRLLINYSFIMIV